MFYRLDQSGEPADFELFGMPESMHRTYVARYRMLDPLHPSRCAPASARSSRLRPNCLTKARRVRVLDPLPAAARRGRDLLRDAGRTVGAFSLLRFEAGDTRGGVAGCSTAARFAPGEIEALVRLQPVAEAALAAAARAARIHRIGCEERLTYREEQIARLVRDGRSNKEIARDLALGQPTVKTHLMRMYRKLGVSNRTELVGALFL